MQKYEMNNLGFVVSLSGIVDTSIWEWGLYKPEVCINLAGKVWIKGLQTNEYTFGSEKLKNEDESSETNENTYTQLVGSLLYLTATRPDNMFAASLLAKYMHNPTKKHCGTAKRVLKYIQGTLDYEIEYKKCKIALLIRYCGSDWNGDENDLKSTSGYAFSFGSGIFSQALVI